MSDVDQRQLIAMLADAGDSPLPGVEAIQQHGLASLAAGRAASVTEIKDRSGLSIDDIRAGIEALQQAGRIEVDGDEVIGVGGLTLTSTVHSLRLPNASLHTWCALDAVGISAALGLNAEISTTCPYCGARLQVTVTDGNPQTDNSLKLFCPTGECSDVRAEFCPAANLFCNAGHLRAWRAAHTSAQGAELDLAATAHLGGAMWGRYRPGSAETVADV